MARMERELNYVASDARVHEQSVAPGSPKSFLCGTLHGLLWLSSFVSLLVQVSLSTHITCLMFSIFFEASEILVPPFITFFCKASEAEIEG